MTAPQRTPAWHAARTGRITASIVGGILGLSPFQTRGGVMRAMVREALGASSEFPDPVPPPVAWGTAMEATAIGEFEMRSGLRVQAVGFLALEDWAGCSPDGLIGDREGIEAKCPYHIRNHENPVFKTLAEQPHYYAQVQFSLAVTDRDKWYFEQWTPHGSRTETVYPDVAWLDDNMPRLRQFHAEYLHELANNADEHLSPLRVVVDTPEAHKMVAEWDQLVEAEERAKERRKDLLAEMVGLAGDKNALLAGRKLTLTERKGSVSYAKALKELAPGADLSKWTGASSSFWGFK